MKLSVSEIAELVKGRVVGDAHKTLDGVSGLSEACESELSYLKDKNDKKSLQKFQTTKAGCVIVPTGLTHNGKTLIEVDHPMAAFTAVLNKIAQEKNSVKPGIHPQSVIDPSVKLGKDVSVGPFVVIEAGASIGDRVRLDAQCYIGARSSIGADSHLYPRVTIREDIKVGARCILHSGVVIGADGFGFYFSEGRHNKIPQIGNVVIEDDVEIGAGTTIDRATTGSTRIGRGSKIDNLVQIAHNVEIGDLSLIVAQVGIGGSSKIGKGVILAGQVGVADHISIGDGAQVGAQSGVKDDIEAKQIIWGTPAAPIQEKMREILVIKKLAQGKKKKS